MGKTATHFDAAAMAADVRSLVQQYARQGYFRHIQTVCQEVTKKLGNDAVLGFWKAFGLAMEGAS